MRCKFNNEYLEVDTSYLAYDGRRTYLIFLFDKDHGIKKERLILDNLESILKTFKKRGFLLLVYGGPSVYPEYTTNVNVIKKYLKSVASSYDFVEINSFKEEEAIRYIVEVNPDVAVLFVGSLHKSTYERILKSLRKITKRK